MMTTSDFKKPVTTTVSVPASNAPEAVDDVAIPSRDATGPTSAPPAASETSPKATGDLSEEDFVVSSTFAGSSFCSYPASFHQ